MLNQADRIILAKRTPEISSPCINETLWADLKPTNILKPAAIMINPHITYSEIFDGIEFRSLV